MLPWHTCNYNIIGHGTSWLYTSVRSLHFLYHPRPAALGSVNCVETCTSVCNLYIAYTHEDLCWVIRYYFQSFSKGCQIIRRAEFLEVQYINLYTGTWYKSWSSWRYSFLWQWWQWHWRRVSVLNVICPAGAATWSKDGFHQQYWSVRCTTVATGPRRWNVPPPPLNIVCFTYLN